jgi:hypothetical protein
MELAVVDSRLNLSTTWTGLHIPASTGEQDIVRFSWQDS